MAILKDIVNATSDNIASSVVSRDASGNFAAGTITATLDGRASVAETYEHEQLTPATVWTITHNLAKFPSVTVIDSGNSVVIGFVEYLSNNQIRLTFSAAFSGKAYLN